MRSVSVDLYQILDLLGTLREEQGTTGWIIRSALADMLVTPPTEAEVRWFLDEQQHRDDCLTTDEALAKCTDEESIDEIWYDTKYQEGPIAEFLMLWDADGNRQDPHNLHRLTPRVYPTWYVTPEKYRA